jgi:hypothetical protein
MSPIIAVSVAYKLGFAVVGLALLMGTLMLFDRLNGVSFGEILTDLRKGDGTPVAIYFGLRLVAVATFFGALLS